MKPNKSVLATGISCKRNRNDTVVNMVYEEYLKERQGLLDEIELAKRCMSSTTRTVVSGAGRRLNILKREFFLLELGWKAGAHAMNGKE